MSHPVRQNLRRSLTASGERHRSRKRGRSVVVLLLLLLTWSLCLGWGLAQAKEPRSVGAIAQIPPAQSPSSPAPVKQSPVKQTTPASRGLQAAAIGTVDVVPPGLKLGQEFYLENCASCHLGLP
ncbi:MAG TPA: hypothetical protein V6C98_07050, partial [Thermosynechococcaceae cyanobacterium]